jgi:hypothetical protein
MLTNSAQATAVPSAVRIHHVSSRSARKGLLTVKMAKRLGIELREALASDIITNNGALTVDDGATLTLASTTIDGGTINDGDLANTGGAHGGTILVTQDSTIDSGAHLNNGMVTVSTGADALFWDRAQSRSADRSCRAMSVLSQDHSARCAFSPDSNGAPERLFGQAKVLCSKRRSPGDLLRRRHSKITPSLRLATWAMHETVRLIER